MEEAQKNRADSPVSNLDGEGGVICSGIEAAKNINKNTDNILIKNMTMQAEHENSEEGCGVAQDVLPGFSCDEVHYFTEQETDIEVEIQSTSPISQIEASQCVEQFIEIEDGMIVGGIDSDVEGKKSIPTNETNEKDSKSSSTSDDTSEEDQSIVPNSYESKLSRASTSTGLFSTQSSSNQKLINKTNGCQQNQSSTNSISTKNYSKAKRYPKRRRASRKIIDTSSDESDYKPRVPPKRSNPMPTLVPRYIYPKKNSKSLNEKPVPIIRYKKYNQLPAPDPLHQEEKIKKQTELCTCEKYIEGSDMIQCDDPDCEIGWFHFDCVGIIIPPKNEWYCPNCH